VVADEVVFLAFHGFDEFRRDCCCQCCHLGVGEVGGGIKGVLFFEAVLGFLEVVVECGYFFFDVFWVFVVGYGSFYEFGYFVHFGLFHSVSCDFVGAYSDDAVGDYVGFLEFCGYGSAFFVVSVVYDCLVGVCEAEVFADDGEALVAQGFG